MSVPYELNPVFILTVPKGLREKSGDDITLQEAVSKLDYYAF